MASKKVHGHLKDMGRNSFKMVKKGAGAGLGAGMQMGKMGHKMGKMGAGLGVGLGKGLLTGRYSPGHVWSPDDERSNMVDFHGEKFDRFCAAVAKLKVIADRKGATMVELATGWVLRQPEVYNWHSRRGPPCPP